MAASATPISRPRPTARRATPIPGSPGEERTIRLRLKLIADAGIVGLPNAGKSTFLAAVSAAKPKIADYPFTTLHPQLGVVEIDGREFVLADIPGLIEGAHEGAGLGDRFLGHVERCRVLLHLVDGTGEHAGKAYKIVRAELEAYGHGLTDKPEIVALNKADALAPARLKLQSARLARAAGKPPLVVSGATGTGVPRSAPRAPAGDRPAPEREPILPRPCLGSPERQPPHDRAPHGGSSPAAARTEPVVDLPKDRPPIARAPFSRYEGSAATSPTSAQPP